jgi:hypothetical protein
LGTISKDTKAVAEDADVVKDVEEAAEVEAADIPRVGNKITKDKAVSKTIKDKDKVFSSKTHKVFMGARRLMPHSPTPLNTSTTGIIVGLMATMCLTDTLAPLVLIPPQGMSGMLLVRTHATAAGRGSIKQPGLDGEGRKRVQ